MTRFVVNKDSVNQNEYQVYFDTSTEDVIAVKLNVDGVEKIQTVGRKYRFTEGGIPEKETVTGIYLRKNPKTEKHEIHSGMEHEFQIRNLVFPGSPIFWE